METVIYKVTIKTKTPFNISTGVKSNGLIKDLSVKDLLGNPYIPGTTVKGVMKSNYRKITSEEKSIYAFGDEGYNPSRVIVDDFKLVKDNNSALIIRFGNAIDRYRKVTKEGALFSKEAVSGVFEGEIEVAIDENISKEDIELSIRMIDSIGGSKSSGFGKVIIECEEEK